MSDQQHLIDEESDEHYQLFGLDNRVSADGVELLPDEDVSYLMYILYIFYF